MFTSYLYSNYADVKKKQKLIYFSPKVWRSVYLIRFNDIHHNSEKRIYSRSSKMPLAYLGQEIVIHSGMRWHTRYVNRWMIGHSIGEYT